VARRGTTAAELERLIELTNDLCCVLTRQGVFKWVNPAWERVLGWSPGEIVGKHAYELIHPDDVARSRELGLGEVANFENRYQAKDGSWRTLLWTATVSEDHWYAIARDVSARTRSRRGGRLRDDHLYRAIIEQTTLGIWAVDAEERTIFANRHLAELLGYDQEELIGLPRFHLMDEESAAESRRAALRRRSLISELREVRLRRRDGSPLVVLSEASPLVDERGEYVGAVAMLTDITARKRAEEQLALLAAVVESSSDAVVACTLDGAVQSWNSAAESLFGYTAREMSGHSLAGILPNGEEGLLALIDAVARRDFSGPLEVDAIAKSQEVVPVELTAFPVEAPDGGVTRIAVTMRDIRERRETERRIEESRRALGDLQRAGRVGTLEWFVDLREVNWSDEVYRIHGVDPGRFEVGREAILSLVHPEDRETFREASDRAAEAFEPFDLRYRIVRADGEVRHLHLRAEPIARSERGRRMTGTIQDVTELAIAEETARAARAELRRQALLDPLTTLPNRMLFLDRLTVALAHAERASTGVAVIVVGLDRFGLINEELGHEFGDQALRAVGQRLVGVMRAGDTVGRLSGDEFAVVCEEIHPAEQAVDMLAGRIVDAFGEPFAIGTRQVYLTASAGVARTDSGEHADALVRRAAAALSAAKERERGSYVVASRLGRPYAGYGRLALRNALRDALDSEQLRVVYQPIVSLSDQRPRAVEALLRWEHPGLGPVSPLEFVPVAEDTGLIIPIGEWVLRCACREIAQLDPVLAVTVNLSPRQLLQQDLPHAVRAALRESGIDPARLVLELTESILVEESESVGRTLAELKALGVRLAIDDFGTGYSALGYLKRFPLDIVKVDRSFVNGLGRDEGDSAIVGAVLGMARALGLEVIAEGVETPEQLACLRELGAEYGQGFYFARPCPPDELDQQLEGRRQPA
jgi:diguanylate cyclase (GGDEF)-like protein/PAS domain S-box-containing protein